LLDKRLPLKRRVEQNVGIQQQLHSFAPRYFLRK
jgi:hypothetical protein